MNTQSLFGYKEEMIKLFVLFACIALLAVGPAAAAPPTSEDDDIPAKQVGGFLAGLKNLLSSRTPYRKLAIDLQRMTNSAELIDNTRAAEAILLHSRDSEDTDKFTSAYEYLVRKFAMLKDTNERVLCDGIIMLNLRPVTQAMVVEHESKSMGLGGGAVRRLNRIVGKLVAKAQSICVAEYERMWQIVRDPEDISEKSERHLSQLDLLTRSLQFLSSDQRRAFSGIRERDFIQKLMRILIDGKRSVKPLANGQDNEPIEWTRDSVANYLAEFVHAPCEQLARSSESVFAVAPYFDFLVASYNARFVQGLEFDKFLRELESRAKKAPISKQVLDRAFRRGLCAKIEVIGDGYLINRLLAEGGEQLPRD